jgi:hypothetical protein
MWFLVWSKSNGLRCVPVVADILDIEHVKREYRAHFLPIVATYRRKYREPSTYDSEGVED